VVVHGFVHGVGFRASCARRAQALGLAGMVRNCPDGTVEAVFQGSGDAVSTMVDWCRAGPPLAKVTGTEVFDEAPQRQDSFYVT
jgi:acylphosphatase